MRSVLCFVCCVLCFVAGRQRKSNHMMIGRGFTLPGVGWTSNRVLRHRHRHHPPSGLLSSCGKRSLSCRSTRSTTKGTIRQRQTPFPVTAASWNMTINTTNKTTVRSIQSLSRRDIAEVEERLWKSVATNVQDSVLGKDLASLDWLHRRAAISEEDGSVLMLLRLPSLLHPNLSELKHDIEQQATKELQAWLSEKGRDSERPPTVRVEAMATKPVPMMARLVEDHEDLLQNLGPGLASVAHFVAVYSCKGGVGKSTVAVNLAYELARLGGRVGLVDLDIYGPSLPLLITPKDPAVRSSALGPGMVHPINHHGVKSLSLGFVAKQSGVPGSGKDNGAAVMRGPFATKVVSQLIKGTDWGELDVLLLDLPPGTGDVQLAVLQDLQLSGAVAVTTPSKLAAADTRKGIEMFTGLGVPTLAVVENMSYFECEGGGKHYPFGRGLLGSDASERIEGIDPANIVQLPISTITNNANDAGEPLCLERPSEATQELSAFHQLADCVSGELLKLQYLESSSNADGEEELVVFGEGPEVFDVGSVSLALDKGVDSDEVLVVRLFASSGALSKRVSGAKLRSCDPKTGEVMPNTPFSDEDDNNADASKATNETSVADSMVKIHKAGGKRSPSVIPTKVERRGRYGFAVEYADGATIIYSKKSLARAAGGRPAQEL